MNTPLKKSKKKLTNRTARKTVDKKLRAVSVEGQSISYVTGTQAKNLFTISTKVTTANSNY